MSGGHFDYNQYNFSRIAEEVEDLVKKNGVENIDRYGWDNDYNLCPEVIEKFKEGVKVMKAAYIYAQRIDYLLSGDDGEISFLHRLAEELNEES